MFYKYSDALVTTLVTKYRVTRHNAATPLHLANGYYAKRKGLGWRKMNEQ